jgi:hypothetical protein
MLWTSLQHRKAAKLLRQKAAKLPLMEKVKVSRMQQSAELHLGLARAQERNPYLAPAAKNPNNQKPPNERPSKPKLVRL